MSRTFSVLVSLQVGGRVVAAGSGTRIGDRHVLTVAHPLLARPDADAVLIRVDGGEQTRAEVSWQDVGRDLVILQVDSPFAVATKPSLKLDVAAGLHWEANGFPNVLADAPSDSLEQIGGSTLSCGRKDEILNLDAEVSPHDMRGLSGAGVWVDRGLAGIIKWMPVGWGARRLQAIPTNRILEIPEIRELLVKRFTLPHIPAPRVGRVKERNPFELRAGETPIRFLTAQERERERRKPRNW